MILPKLDYCDFIWNSVSDTKYNHLEHLQTHAARIILKHWNISHDESLNQLGWKSLRSRSTMHRNIFVFRCLNCNVSDLFKKYFIKTCHMHFTIGNGVDLITPKISTEVARRSLYYQGVVDFNRLPTSIKQNSSITIFKSRLTDIF